MNALPSAWPQLPNDPATLLGLRPQIDTAFVALYRSVWAQGVDARILELCRLRSAQILRAEGPLHRRTPAAEHAGLAEVDVAKLAGWRRNEHFDDVSAAAISFTEQFLFDPNGIDKSLARAVGDAVGDAGLVTFVIALALFESYQRMCVLFELQPSGPTHLCRFEGPHWSCPP